MTAKDKRKTVGRPRQRYRALRGLNYPTDPDVIRRIQAGEKVPVEERRETRVEAGEIVTDLPPVVERSYLARGDCIEEVGASG